MNKKRLFAIILAILLLLALLQFGLEGESLLRSMGQIPIGLALLLLGLQIVSQLLVNLQWHQIAKFADIPISFQDMLYVNCQGAVVDFITPGVKIGGEVARAVQISRMTNCPGEQSAALVALQKLFSISALLLIFLFAMGRFLALPFLLIVLCLFFLMSNHIKVYLQTKKDPRFSWVRKIKSFAIILSDQVANVRKNTKTWVMLFLLSLFIWLLYPAKMYILAVQFFPEADIMHIAAITFTAYMVAMLPIFPGGLGGFEATMSALLVTAGFALGDAAAATIFFRFATFWFVMLLGLVFIAFYKARKKGEVVLLMKYIPNLLTLINMSLGLISVLLIIQADHPYKGIIVPALIILGGATDFLDGYFARKLKATSVMGKQLDSFADIITFGIAPICLINYVFAGRYSVIIIMASVIFMMAGAYRLARYNLNDFSSHFMGLPITAAGIALALYCAAYPLWAAHFPGVSLAITALFITLLAIMMLSKRKVRRLSR